eukprot:Opistho-1_new@73931
MGSAILSVARVAVAVVLATSVLALGRPLTSRTIGHQLHSFNDVRQWRQLILKGGGDGVFFKIDGHYANPSFCASQHSLAARGIDPRGCFVLVHDPPVPHQQYFNSYDVLEFLSDPLNAPLLRRPSAAAGRSDADGAALPAVLLYFSWKSDDPMFPPVNGTADASLAAEWMRNVTAIIATRSLDIAVVSGYAGTSDTWCPDGSDLTNPMSCLYVSDGECAGKDVLNCEANPIPFDPVTKNLHALCAHKFGRFANATTPFPWVFYEPSDQASALSLLDAYLDCDVMAPKGLRVAINIDPIQFQVTAATRSGIGLNEHLVYSDALHSAKLAVTVCDDNSVRYVVAFTELASSGISISYVTATVGEDGRAAVTVGPVPLPYGGVFGGPLVSLSSGASPHVIVASDGTVAVSMSLDCLSGVLENVTVANLTRRLGHRWGVAMVPSALSPAIVSVSRLPSCAAFVAVETLGGELLGDGACVVPDGVVTSAAVSVTEAGDECAHLSGATAAGAISYTANANVYVTLICADAETGKLSIASGPTALGPGSNTSVAALSVVGADGVVRVAIAELHSDGFCFNSDWNNKRAFPLVCDAVPTPMALVMDYNVGTWDDFVALAGIAAPYATPCGPVMHGTFDLGRSPSVALHSRRTADGALELGLAEVHAGFGSGSVDCNGCGFPNHFDGVVLDGWPLPPHMTGAWLLGDSRVASPTAVARSSLARPSPVVQAAPVAASLDPCVACVEAIQAARIAIQHDYQLVSWLTTTAAATCDISHFVLGGDKVGCENFIFMYGPEIVVEALTAILANKVCQLARICRALPAVTDGVAGHPGARGAVDDESIPAGVALLSPLCATRALADALAVQIDEWVASSNSRMGKAVGSALAKLLDKACNK